MSDHFDDLETRSQEARAAALAVELPRQVAHAKAATTAYGESLAAVDAAAITSLEALAALPVTRKEDLIERQGAAPPFGGLAAIAPGAARRVFASPGPIHELESDRNDYWRAARALYAAGFRRGELIHNCFSYHLTPGGWILDGGARALGCAVFPGGVGNSEQQAAAMAHFRPDGYTGTPDFLQVILDKAGALGLDCGSVKKALVSGGALFPALRQAYRDQGIAVLQCYATADLGVIAYESPAQEGLIIEEGVALEIVRPGTGEPLPDGEVGEVVVTTFDPDYPLIRFATGDLSAILPGASPCGRTNRRVRGWMGRADQTTKVKGMFVHPKQVAEVLARHPEVRKARLVVTRVGAGDAMTLFCETGAGDPGLLEALAASLQAVCKLKGQVELVAPGSLANDGKVIDDRRSYD